MSVQNPIFNRLNLLLGEETMERVLSKRVIIFGVGGVGSWCAESLVRSGICHLTIVDSDCVCITNVNRQLHATECPGKLFSAMGAALKMDPTKIQVTEFWKVKGCPLASIIRKRLRKEKTYPKKKFLCVFSPEVLPNKGTASTCGTSACMCPKAITGAGNPNLINHEWCSSKAQINGTSAHITAIFGFMLAGLVMQDINSLA